LSYTEIYLLPVLLYVDYADRPIAFKHADKIQKDGSWLTPDHVHGYKDLRFAQKIDDPRSHYSILRGMNKRILFLSFITMISINPLI